jgi:uncharacterized protein (DUF2141 family)
MLRLPRPLDMTRACPLILLEKGLLTPVWERLADKNHVVLAFVGSSQSEIGAALDEAKRSYPIDPERLFLVGPELAGHFAAFHDSVASASEKTDPESAWKELKTSHLGPVKHSRLVVTVRGLRNAKGVVAAQLFTGEEDFKKRTTEKMALGEIGENRVARLVFEKLDAGMYALLFLHDENKNGKMDTRALGIPKEGFGASRDPKVRFGPPRWRDCCFLLTNAGIERELTIKTQYL